MHTVVAIAMKPRPYKSPARTAAPAGKCPAVSATSTASAAPNQLAAILASVRGLGMRQPTPSTHRNRGRMAFEEPQR
eukprot:2197634-Pyramimonas_sp.AAC.1